MREKQVNRERSGSIITEREREREREREMVIGGERREK